MESGSPPAGDGGPLQDLITNLDVPLMLRHLGHLVLAYVLAVPIGWDRERDGRTAGLRTFPLVAVAACGYTLVGFDVLTSTDAESRVVAGLITGMGFIGGGAILKRGVDEVHGTATAAALWITGAVGMAVALGRLEVALLSSLATFLTLRLLTPIKERVGDQAEEGAGDGEESGGDG